jgi:hypothetical protein
MLACNWACAGLNIDSRHSHNNYQRNAVTGWGWVGWSRIWFSNSIYRCILGISQMSSEVSDLDLLFQGHFAPDVCWASFGISPPQNIGNFRSTFHPQIGGTRRGIPYPQGSSLYYLLSWPMVIFDLVWTLLVNKESLESQ